MAANSPTTKALFYIKGKNVQHVGCRLLITRAMIHAGFTKGGAFNLPDGRVEVVLEGSKEDIESFHHRVGEELIDWIIERAEDKKEIKRKIGNPGIKVEEIEWRDDIIVLDIGLFSHSLTFDQIYKGVDVYKDLTKAISELRETLRKTNKG